MQPDWAQPFIITYFVAWVGLGIGSWWIIRTRTESASKTLWYRRSMIALAALVIAAGIPIVSVSRAPNSLAFFCITFVPVVVLICAFNVATTYFCPLCGRRVRNRNVFAKTFHCPRCGHRLKPV